MAAYHLRFLGTAQVERDGEPVRGFESRKALALLGYLAVQRHPVPREQLADLFWGDRSEARGRANLSWVLNRISSLLPGCLATDRHSIQFQRAAPYWLDIVAFEELEAQGDAASLAAAVKLYRGEFLEGLYLDGCPEYEIWAVGERERWCRRVAQVLGALVTHHSQHGEHDEALRFAQQVLVLEPWWEEAHRQVMRLLAWNGQRGAALAQYDTCCRVLAEELGVEPAGETTALYERILAATSMRRHNLPPQPTPFVGREEELAEVAGLLDNPDCRLLTIFGPGGIGKTRLALQAAAARTEAFLEGVYFVPLADVSSADFLISAIADALQFSLAGLQDPQIQLLNYLRNREVLLILDSFEHLLAGTALLDEVLQEAPEVRLLVTSRERLNLRWERCFEIEGLRYPEGETSEERDLEHYSAVQLLLQTACRVRRQFSLSRRNRPAVARICQLVEGMPLGIELAAAWVKTCTCEEIAQEIEGNLDFLATSLQDVPERHRSVRATFERSWRMLTPSEQAVLAKLSVFRGGFSRERAGEIGDASSAILESLVDRSLLRFLPSGRYEMHELLRQYAAEKLAALPEAQTEARDRHCAHYSAFLQHWEADLIGAGAAEALTAIRVEMANVRAAWNWGATRAKLEEIARGLDGLSRYYLLAGPFREGETLIGMAVDQVRAHVGQDEEAGRDVRAVLGRLLAEQAHLLNLQGMHEEAIVAARAAIDQAEGSQAARAETAGYLQWGLALWCQGEYGAARSRLERALTLARVAQLHLLEGDSLRNLGIVCHYLEDWAGARACHEQAWRIYQAIGDRRGEGSSLVNLGLISHAHGDYAGARVCYEEALCISREIGDRRNEGIALANLGLMCNQQGDYAGARACYEEAMRISREIGNRRSESIVLSNLALLCHRQGNDGAALQYGKQALHLAQDIGDRPIQAYALMHLGHALEGLGPLSEAAEVYQQALVLRQELGQQNLAIESLAGAARVSLAQGNLTQAQAQVEEILAHLETNIRSTTHDTAASGHGLHGAVEPFRVYLTCYRVLRAGQDLRAQEILNTAHRLLQEQAARISDEELRRSFLENVAAHREIVEEVRARDNAQYRSAVF